MCPERDNDGAHAALTTEDDSTSMARGPEESFNSNDNDNHLGSLTAEDDDEIHQRNVGRRKHNECMAHIIVQQTQEGKGAAMIKTRIPTSVQSTRSDNNGAPGVRQSSFTETETKANQLNDKPPNSKSLKRQRYNERKRAKRLEEAAVDVDPATVDNTTPTSALQPNTAPRTPIALESPAQQPQPQSSKDFKIVDGVSIPIAEWRRAKKARLRAKKAENRKRGRQQQRQSAKENDTAQREDKTARAATETRMELDSDGPAPADRYVPAYTHTTDPNDDDDDTAAMGDDESSASETRDGRSSTTVAAMSKTEIKRQKYMKMEAKRAKRERNRFFKSQRKDLTAEEKQADFQERNRVRAEAQEQMRIAAAKRKALAEAEASKASKAGGGGDRKRRGRDEEEDEDLEWEAEGLGFKRLRISEV